MMTREDAPEPPEALTAEEKADEKAALEQDLAPAEASADQAEASAVDKERMLLARSDERVPFPSPTSRRFPHKKGGLAGEPDPLTPRDHDDATDDRDPLVPAVAAEETAAPESERQVDPETGRVESEDERDARLVAAEKAAAARRKARKEKANATEKAAK